MKKYFLLALSFVAYLSSYGQNIADKPETFEGSAPTYKWVTKKGKINIVANPNISSGNTSSLSALITKDSEGDVCNTILFQKIDLSKNQTLKIKFFADKDANINFMFGKRSNKKDKIRTRIKVKGNSTWKEYTVDLKKAIEKSGVKDLKFDFFKIIIAKDKKSTKKGSFYIDDIGLVK